MECDLVLEIPGHGLWALDIKRALSAKPERGFHHACEDLKPQYRFLVHSGANIWLANYGTNTVTKLRASDGANLGTFPVGVNPDAVVFNGANIWGANGADNTVTKLRAGDGTFLGTFSVGSAPNTLAFDGANVWVTNSTSNTVNKL